MDITAELRNLRSQIAPLSVSVSLLKKHDFFSRAPEQRAAEDPKPDDGEMIANITLAYRHLEDARMRLGKAIQAFDGGDSCYGDA